MQQGGVMADGDKVTDIKAVYRAEAFAGEGMIVKKGKKNFRKVVMK